MSAKYPRSRWQHWLLLVIIGIGLTLCGSAGQDRPVVFAQGGSSLAGRVLDPQGEPTREAELHLQIHGDHLAPRLIDLPGQR